ncbi:SDR family oxidoreductase [Rhodococcus fascians]|nr:SDR family oxidoreductase [Rhodococcus fascians]MBY4114556.1 SDR family oxidoreductase [Rhodococcus fascians]
MSSRLLGRTAVVTGGTTGIGQEIAVRLASEGANIAVADVDDAAETKRLVEAEGRRFVGGVVDISSEEEINSFARKVRDQFDTIDIVVNNAAVVIMGDFDQVTYEDWRKTFSVNVDGPFLTTKAFLPDLKRSAAGRIINISSSSYWNPPPPMVSYVSAKGALNGLTSVLSANLAPHGITANSIAPSLVRTASSVSKTNEAFFDHAVRLQDIGRVQLPADVTGTVVFLASDDSAFVTGQIIVVDGGSTRR